MAARPETHPEPPRAASRVSSPSPGHPSHPKTGDPGQALNAPPPSSSVTRCWDPVSIQAATNSGQDEGTPGPIHPLPTTAGRPHGSRHPSGDPAGTLTPPFLPAPHPKSDPEKEETRREPSKGAFPTLYSGGPSLHPHGTTKPGQGDGWGRVKPSPSLSGRKSGGRACAPARPGETKRDARAKR